MYSTAYDSCGDGFCKGGYLSFVKVLGIVRCSLWDGGSGIDGVEVMVMMIVWSNFGKIQNKKC